ncbi:glycosyltransferase family 25 protein [Comamonas nitrativorans]|uniref:Glycosyltransferase family 25 protein n=1 Tax=Comamonas nitrativorans TaxID=108437 RepID=A0ABV9GYX1_9BURK
MKIIVNFINLEKDDERCKRMQAQLENIGFPVERFSAVWWNDLTPAAQENLFSSSKNALQYYKPLANGEKGCYASHIHVWRKLLASDAQAMVVLEDDVRLHTDFSEVIHGIARIGQPWDMIKLVGRSQEKVRAQRPLVAGHGLIQYARVPSLTAAYVISRAGAEKLLRTRVPFGRPVDVDLRFWFENDLHVFGVLPAAVSLDDTSEISSIWQQRSGLTLPQRWRKFCMKLQLAWGNARARQPQLPLS